MTTEAIDLSSDGIKFPYRRFLTDAATGVATEGLLLALLWNPLQLRTTYSQLTGHIPIACLLTLALMSAPIGVAFSSLSFVVVSPILFLLELLVLVIARIPLLGDILLLSVHRLCVVTPAFERFDIRIKTYFATTTRLAIIAEAVFPRLAARFLHLEGIVILLRNLGTLSLLSMVILPREWSVYGSLPTGIALLGAGAIISFFGRCDILGHFYLYSEGCGLTSPSKSSATPAKEIGLREFANTIRPTNSN